MSSKRLGISLTLALAAALAVPTANALVLNVEAFREAGGDPDNIAATYAQATQARMERSRQAPFDGVGTLWSYYGMCTATWLGNDADHAWILTAKHCTSADSTTWSFTAPTVSVSGVGRRYLPPGHASGIGWDIALIAIPLGVPSTQWNAITKPLLYDGAAEVGRTTHLAGQGLRGVGSQTQLSTGRMWGTTKVTGAFASDTGLVAGYHANGKTDLQVRAAGGDSGSAWWQQHAGGYWGIVAVHSTGTSGGSNGTRVNRHVEWIKGVFPGATTFSERFTVTEAKPFVSRNHAEDVDHGTVYYLVAPGQTGVHGPTRAIWTHTLTHSNITVTAKDAITGAEHPIVLRGTRNFGCGNVRMEDGVRCNTYKMGPLMLVFHAQDNAGLPSGEWKAKFDVEAIGWHRPYRERLPITVDIRNLVQGRVTKTSAYRSPNFAAAASRGTVYYLVPPQAGASGPTSRIWSHVRTHGTMQVLVREASTGFERHIVLRTSRSAGWCGDFRMNDGILCFDYAKMGPLTAAFHAADNPDLPAGKWRGVAYIRAKGWHDHAVDEAIRLNVEIDQ